ncbi:HlyD family secretion protein [Kaistella antarctica]|uniref:ABC transporter permease n=1 Tax=Kaistella antarctica TaxID=266748 RepID=A0A3S4W1U5_9FLAO|nr:biotin/lipoyl-binding protein [Kaistella antarctica]KEY19681.1 ABC transporter permease [Kaistella antarctica]SEV99022.1 HlyD family secretion protein [Kaistella antarctica]VEH96768.1 putative efflux pump membrane fusion protein [Kaistella antarctica]
MKNSVLTSLALASVLTLAGCKESKQERLIVGKTRKEVVSFSPKLTGRILKIYVEEGQSVKVGDTLAMLDVPEVSAKIAQAKGATSSARAQVQLAKNGASPDQLRQLKAKQNGLQEQFKYAQKSFGRAKNMYRDSLLSPQNYDEYFAKYQGAKAQLDAVNAELHDVQLGTRYEKIEMAQGQQNQAMGALQEANVAYSERYVIATNEMEIETISLNKGELATAGYPLFTGYIPETSYFRFTIPESKIAKYQKGMSVKMVVNYSNKEFAGKIVSIKQLAKYADITTAFPDYEPEEAIYEIKVVPVNPNLTKDILVNSNVTLK